MTAVVCLAVTLTSSLPVMGLATSRRRTPIKRVSEPTPDNRDTHSITGIMERSCTMQGNMAVSNRNAVEPIKPQTPAGWYIGLIGGHQHGARV